MKHKEIHMAQANLDIRLRVRDDGSVVITRTTRRLRDMGDAGVKAARSMEAAWRRVAGVLGAAFASYQLSRFAADVLSTADALAKTADKVGLTTEALQELRYAAERAGVDARTLDMAMQRFSRRVGEAAQGKGELVEVLRQYGIAVTDARGRTRALEDILADLADAIASAGSEQERLRIAFKAFDSEGAALVNALRQGSAGLEQMRARARELGLVMDADLVRRAEALNDRLAELGTSLRVRFGEAVLELAPSIERLASELLTLTREVNLKWWAETAADGIRVLSDAVGALTDSLRSLRQMGPRELGQDLAALGGVYGLEEGGGGEPAQAKPPPPPQGTTVRISRTLDQSERLKALMASEEVWAASFAELASRLEEAERRAADQAARKRWETLARLRADEQRMEEERIQALVRMEEEWAASFADIQQRIYEAERENAERRKRLEEEVARHREMLWRRGLSVAQSVFGEYADFFRQLYEDSAGQREKYWRMYKRFAIAETIVSTATAAMNAYKALAGIPIVGPALGASTAASIAALGAAKVHLIEQQRPARAFAEGGIVMAPTVGLVGEAGPEVIIPLERLPQVVERVTERGPTIHANVHVGPVSGDVGPATVAVLRRLLRAEVPALVRGMIADDPVTIQLVRRRAMGW